jgi:paraquat-inducible protein B
MKPPSSRTIGLFVVGAFGLLVAALILFGSRSFLEFRPRAVTFFHGSVAGLNVGAPVTFRGVRVGAVVDVALRVEAGSGAASIPVVMEFEPERITVIGDPGGGSFAKKMAARGLGAALVMQSLITGQLAIELDYHPESERTLSGTDVGLPEIPEARTGLSAMKETISRLPFQELADTALDTLRGINRLVADPSTGASLQSAAATLKSTAATMAMVESEAPALVRDLRSAAAATRQAVEHADALLADARPQVGPALEGLVRVLAATEQKLTQVAAELHVTLGLADRALARSETMLGDAGALVGPRSSVVRDLEALMRTLATAAQSLRSFAEQVDRNPNSLVMGSPRR